MSTYTYKEPPDLTDAGIAEAFVEAVIGMQRREGTAFVWVPEKARWAYLIGGGSVFGRWMSREELEAGVRTFLGSLHRVTVEAARSDWGYRSSERILKRAERLRSAAIISTVIRLAKSDLRLHRSLDSLKTYKGEPAEVATAKEVA